LHLLHIGVHGLFDYFSQKLPVFTANKKLENRFLGFALTNWKT